ncbi:MAG: phosphate regulon transcriptional regulator PhoB [Pseudomonadota bacterium]
MAGKILIIEDEPAISEMLGFTLARAGYAYDTVANAEQAQAKILAEPPMLILLDWMLPGISGVDYARRLKKEKLTAQVPIIMLTARGEQEDKIKGLESGADDYVTKPFSPQELLARIKAVLRRTAPQAVDEVIEIDELRLDPAGHRVTARGETLEMGPTEFRLLHFFMTHSERVYSRGQLLDLVWGRSVYVEERTVDVHIRRLRRALERHGHDRLIQTVRGAGYRLSMEA